MDNIRTEKLLETIYQNLIENIPDNVCTTCPVVMSLRTTMTSLKRQNNDEIANQFGLDVMDFSCPFAENKPLVRRPINY